MKPFLLFALAGCCYLQGATYYVDSSQGRDANAGTSAKQPWQSLEKVNAVSLQAGDQIFLRSGSVWQGHLALRSSNSGSKVITVDRYGPGPLPRINGAGRVPDAVSLYNLQNIELRHLEVTNLGATPGNRRGVHIFLDNYGTAKHIVIADLYVHDVNGSNGTGDNAKDNGGIIFRTVGDRVPSRFDGLTIERNIVWKVDRSAIAANSYHWPRNRWFPSLHVVIRDNFVDDIGGDGIVPWATDGALIEHNIARNCNRRAHSYNAGIWPWSTDNSLFQLNEASFTRTTLDGEGFDSDFNSRNTVFQYNYSHDNEGGFMLICTPGERNAQENLGNIGTVVRHNISRNDHSRIFNLSAAEKTRVEENAIYIGPDLDVQLLLVSDWKGWANDALFRGNLFAVEGVARYGHETKRAKDGSYEIGPGWGPAKGIRFEGNRYIGKNVNPPEDAKQATEKEEKLPKLDWKAPEFDPARPEGFPAFLKDHRRWMMHLFTEQFGKFSLAPSPTVQ